MQRCTCTVRLSGDVGHTVALEGVSPAEVLVLRRIHGEDAVVDFAPDGNDRGKAGLDEVGRLKGKYGDHFDASFPGSAPKLPIDFEDIGVTLYEITIERKPVGRQKKVDESGVKPVTADDLVKG
jgi:hypothetical protein